MTEKPDAEVTCYRCGNPIEPWQPFVRRLAGNNIDVRHGNTDGDCKATKKPKEVK